MPMTLRLTAAETEALRETARREHRSMQEVARIAIDEYVTRRDATSRRAPRDDRARGCGAPSPTREPVTEHLDLDDLLAAAEAALGRPPDIRDIGILEAAVARTRASVYGEDAYPDLDAKAAALLHSIVTGHALIDGNKRLGWVAVRLFYRLNDRDLRAPIDDAFDLVIAIADGSIRDVASIAARLRAWSSKLDGAG